MTELETFRDVIDSILKTKKVFEIPLNNLTCIVFLYNEIVTLYNKNNEAIISYNGRESFIEQPGFRSSSISPYFFYKHIKKRCDSISELLIELQTILIEMT